MKKCRFSLGAVPRALLVVGTLLWSSLPVHAQSRPADRDLTAQLQLLRADSSAVATVPITALPRLYEFLATVIPQTDNPMPLVQLAAQSILRFNPFVVTDWETAGFDIRSKIAIQLPTAVTSESGTIHWHTRIVLKTGDSPAAQNTARQHVLGFRYRRLIPVQQAANHKQLTALGVFVIDAILPNTFVIVSQRQTRLLVDIVAGPGDLLALPFSSPANGPNIPSLHQPGLGVWVRPEKLANTWSQRSPHCQFVAKLATNSAVQAIFGNLRLTGTPRFEWQMRFPPNSPVLALLPGEPGPATQFPDSAYSFSYAPGNLAALRRRERSPSAQDWPQLWQRARTCDGYTKVVVALLLGPDVVGLFLDELATLHPDAAQLVDSLGLLQVSAERAEIWVRAPGDDIARRWLTTIFGPSIARGNSLRFGRGPMFPYSLQLSKGSLVGVTLSLRETKSALRLSDRPLSENSATLLQGFIAPAQLYKHPLLAPLARSIPFTFLKAKGVKSDHALTFTLQWGPTIL